jgi:glycine cleavage system H protein
VIDIPGDRSYSKEHEWALEEGDVIRVGITDYAQEQLGDVVFVGLPEPGTEVEAGKPLGEVESTKSVSDVYSPVSGKVVAKNEAVEANPEKVNDDPYGEGWLVIVEASAKPEGMMDSDAYKAHIDEA